MPKRRTRGEGGLVQRHDHATCPPAEVVIDANTGDPAIDPDSGQIVKERPEHRCRGRHQGTIDVVGPDGTTRRKYVYGRTREEARRKLREAVALRDTGALVVGGTTIEAWLAHWLEHIAEVRPQTYRGYKSKIDCYLVPYLGKHKLTALRSDHVRVMYAAMRSQGLAEASLRQTHAILARALKVAVQEGKLGRNPLDAVKPPSTKTKRRPQLTMAQAQQVLAFTDDARWWLAIFYGMRQGEVLGLRWCDVNLELGYLYVVQTLQKGRDGKPAFGPPKSDAGERTVPLIPVMAARIKLAHAAAGSPHPESAELVFPGTHHDGRGTSPRDPKKDWLLWRELLAAASTEDSPLPAVSLHSARNTAASLLEAAGVPPRLVGQIIGHSNVKQTEHYQHAEMVRMVAALEAGASLLDLAELADVVDAEIVEDEAQE